MLKVMDSLNGQQQGMLDALVARRQLLEAQADALLSSIGQVVVGKENKYPVVYGLVNTIYVLGIPSTDEDDSGGCNHYVRPLHQRLGLHGHRGELVDGEHSGWGCLRYNNGNIYDGGISWKTLEEYELKEADVLKDITKVFKAKRVALARKKTESQRKRASKTTCMD